MIGDRYLTDVVYGNRNGLLTVRPAPLTLEGEPSAVLFVSHALTPVTAVQPAFDYRWTAEAIVPFEVH